LIIFSRHAREQIIARGISVNEVEEGIKKGAKEFQSPDKILFHYRYFTIVTKKMKDNYFIITVKPRW